MSWSARTLLAIIAAGILAPAQVSARGAGPPDDLSRWTRLETSGFVVLSDAGKARSRRVALDFVAFRAAVATVLPTLEAKPERPIHVYAFKNGKSFAPFRPDEMTAGYFVRAFDTNYIALRLDAGDAKSMVQHEYVHYLLANNLLYVPSWLDEGLAHYLETFEISRGVGRVGLANKNLVEWLNAFESWMPLDELLRVRVGSEIYHHPQRGRHFRAESWALVHYLFYPEEERRARTSRVFELMSDGKSSPRALTEAFGVSLPELQNTLRRHIGSRTFRYAIVPEPRLPSGAEARVQPMDRGETLCHLGHLLARVRSAEAAEAGSYFDEALTLMPDDPSALMGQAIVRLRQERWEEAETLLSRVIELEPSNKVAGFLLASAKMKKFAMEDDKPH